MVVLFLHFPVYLRHPTRKEASFNILFSSITSVLSCGETLLQLLLASFPLVQLRRGDFNQQKYGVEVINCSNALIYRPSRSPITATIFDFLSFQKMKFNLVSAVSPRNFRKNIHYIEIYFQSGYNVVTGALRK